MSDEKRHISRRADDSVSKAELGEFVAHIDGRLAAQDTILTEQNEILEDQNRALKRINDALFAEDANNANSQPGLMYTARNIDAHIRTVCKVGRWMRGMAVAGGTLLVSAAAAKTALKALGLM